jgi:anti-sigma factor RsiW
MSCVEKAVFLHGMLDGELDVISAMEFEAHLEGCAGCAEEYERQVALRIAIRLPQVSYRAPVGLHSRIVNSLESTEAPSRPSTRWWREFSATRPWPVGVMVAAAASLLLFIAMPDDQATLQQELIAGHVRSLLANHLTDVTTSDQHTVKPWFNSKLDVSPPVVDLADAGFPLSGGRLDYLHNRVVGALVYKHAAHVINLFVWPAPDVRDAAPDSSSREGYNLLHWTRSGMSFWVVSDLNAVELRQFQGKYSTRTAF